MRPRLYIGNALKSWYEPEFAVANPKLVYYESVIPVHDFEKEEGLNVSFFEVVYMVPWTYD